jgi:diguanylate cyclase (GGDEF)-like protein
VRGIVTIARWAETSSRVDRVIGLLASQRPIEEVLAELVHLLDRPGWQLAVALQYGDGEGGLRATTSHRDERLTGADPASIGSGPWADARRTNGPVADVGLHTLAPPARAAAQAAGFVTCWAVPVRDPLGEPAVLVVWSGEPREPELGQDLVLQRLLSLVELALDGRARSTELHRAANCDPLTGLWNRRYLEQAAAEASTARRPGSVAVVLCDLDGFKAVNDGFGHPAGDHVIQVVAARLRNAVRAGDVVSRIGGDEFAILCTGVDDAFDVEVVAQRILAAIDQPIPSDVGVLRVGVSVGIAVDDDDAWDLDQLIRRADARLLEAKAAGKATYRISVGARG